MRKSLSKQFEPYLSDWMESHLKRKFGHLEETVLEERVEEFFKFIYIISLHPGSFIPVNYDIDEIWHEYILQTEEYQGLCEALPGKRFIHHRSNTLEEYSEKKGDKQVIHKMLMWLPLHYKYFGPFSEKSAKYWSIVTALIEEKKLSLEQINMLAERESGKLA